MGQIITANKASRIDQLEANVGMLVRDMQQFWQLMTNLSILVDAHSRILGIEKVKEECDRFMKQKEDEAKVLAQKVILPPSP